MRIYLDSCIVIYQVEAIAPWFAPVNSAMNNHASDEFCFTDLTRLECRLIPLRTKSATVLANFDRFFNLNTVLTLEADVYDLATQFRADHGLKTPDAIHLAAALRHGCSEFWTNDLRLAKAGQAIGFRTFP